MSDLTVTLIQSSLHWEDSEANLKMFREKIMSISEKTSVVILPEMFSTGFSMKPEQLAETMDGPSVQWMKAIAAEKKIILTGSLIIKEQDQYFNRLIWMLPNGNYGYYDKRHRFAYAGEDKHYTPGNRRLIASVNGWKINLQICYDLRFPVWARQQMNKNSGALSELPPHANNAGTPEYDVLVYVANWPERRSTAWQTLLQARAIENQCYVIGVNRVGDDGNKIHYGGHSVIHGPLGEVLYSKAQEEDIFTYTLSRKRLEETRNDFPFWRDADDFRIMIPNEEKVQ